MLAPSAARVAEETLTQELALLDGSRDVKEALGEVAVRVDLALRLTHPSGGPLARGCLTIVQIGPDGIVLGATRTGSAIIVDGHRDVMLATPKIVGRMSSAIGGRLDDTGPTVRLGWARLPALTRDQRLVLATRDLSVLYTPAELVDRVGQGPTESTVDRLMQLAHRRGEGDMVAAIAVRQHTRLSSRSSAQRSPVVPTVDFEEDPDTMDSLDTIDPLATHHGTVPFVLGRLDRWLIEARQRGSTSGPEITLLGPTGWKDLDLPISGRTPTVTQSEDSHIDHSLSGLPRVGGVSVRRVTGGVVLVMLAAALGWLLA